MAQESRILPLSLSLCVICKENISVCKYISNFLLVSYTIEFSIPPLTIVGQLFKLKSKVDLQTIVHKCEMLNFIAAVGHDAKTKVWYI